MASVTAAMVKELREKTGAGMMDCKNALNETAGDVEAAVDWLRKKGLSKAAKKSGRVTAEGLVAVAVDARRGVAVEVNSETDFVARNEDFQKLVRAIARVALDTGADIEALKEAAFPGGGTVTDAIRNAVATIGENITLRRAAGLEVEHGVISHYVHNSVSDGLGKIGVIVALELPGPAGGGEAELKVLGRQIAMHVAAASPQALDASGLDPAVVAREKAILAEKNAGKPPHVIDKIVESGLRSFSREVCLIDQVSVHADHGGKTIGQVLQGSKPAVIKGFVRFALGEGIDKQETDFAAEVAAAAAPKPADKDTPKT